MWLDPFEMSKWAYYYCQRKNSDNPMKKLITHPKWAYMYCHNIYNDSDLKKYITGTKWEVSYDTFIKNSPGENMRIKVEKAREINKNKNIIKEKKYET